MSQVRPIQDSPCVVVHATGAGAMTRKPWCERLKRVSVDDYGFPVILCSCDEPDPRDPTGANDRRDGKDRRAWGTPIGNPRREWLRSFYNRRQSDRRGGE